MIRGTTRPPPRREARRTYEQALQLVRAFGAHRVIDYTREDFTRGESRYDLIFHLAGTHAPAACRRALTPTGTLVLSSGDSKGRWLGPLNRVFQAALLSPFVSQKLAKLDTKRARTICRS
jgi:NADPH:quinone reductase-like Zn-dependent oxidoreductase